MQLMLIKPSSFFTNVSQKASSDTDFSGHFENSCRLGKCFVQKGPRGIGTFPHLTQVSVALLEVSLSFSVLLHTVVTSVFSSFKHHFKGKLLKIGSSLLKITTRAHCPIDPSLLESTSRTCTDSKGRKFTQAQKNGFIRNLFL